MLTLAHVTQLQIWHALENHRYLHAARLYAIAKRVHDTDMGFVDVQVCKMKKGISGSSAYMELVYTRPPSLLYNGNGMLSVSFYHKSFKSQQLSYGYPIRHRRLVSLKRMGYGRVSFNMLL